jgi:hypothetical protein
VTRAGFLLAAHGLDAMTLVYVAAAVGIAGEANPLARELYGAAGPLALVAFKAAGVGLLMAVVGTSQLRLALAVLAGLAGALVNALAWSSVT